MPSIRTFIAAPAAWLAQFWRASPRRAKTAAAAVVTLGAVVVGMVVAAPGTYTVNSNGDAGDATLGDGICATAGGVCTLRAAIQEANSTSGAKTINFNLPSCTASSTGTLGAGLSGTYFNTVDLSGSVVLTRNEAVNFDWSTGTPGVSVNSDNFSVRWNGTVTIPASGTYRFQTNGDDGVRLWVNGTLVINNWADHPATLDTSASLTFTAGQVVAIRLEYYERTGYAVMQLRWETPSTPGTFNAIPASVMTPVTYAPGCSIQPTSALPAVTAVVTINGQSQPGWASNPIVELAGTNAGTNVTGLTLRAGSSTVRGLVINQFSRHGIELADAGGNSAQGNWIGLNLSGNAAASNGGEGINVWNSPNNTIGGTTAATRNVISGNGNNGITLAGTSTGAQVQGNLIGCNAACTARVGNGSLGMYVGTGSNTIGGTAAGAGNTVVGNNGSGVYIENGSGNTVQGNYLGTTAAGASGLGNTGPGLYLQNTPNAVVGGTTAGAGNVISGNGGIGLLVGGSTNFQIQGNTVGLTPNGLAMLANGSNRALWITAANGTNSSGTVGGTTTAARNLFVATTGSGSTVLVSSNGSAAVAFQGNYVGLYTDGSLAGSAGDRGVMVGGANDSTSNVTIGGTATGAGNVIANTQENPVRIAGTGSGNAVLGNLMYGSSLAKAGIDISIDQWTESTWVNDGAKTAGNANLYMDAPVFTSVVRDGSNLRLQGYVGSAAGQALFASSRVEVFRSDQNPKPTAREFLGSFTTGGTGSFDVTIVLPGGSGLSAGNWVTGTATDTGNNTSKLAANATVIAPNISGTVFEDLNYGGGAGRNRSTAVAAGGAGVAGATVELYAADGSFVNSTTTSTDGTYSFAGLGTNHYVVRVLQSSVRSNRSGSTASVVGVQTFRQEASWVGAAAVTDQVGGTDPAATDAGAAPTLAWTSCATENATCSFTGTRLVRYGVDTRWTTRVLTGGTACTNGVFGDPAVGTVKSCLILTTALHSVSSASTASGNITGVDFGFNFSTVTNTNDSGAGSLRQFIVNANALGGEASLAQAGRTAGVESALFVLPTSSAGYQAGTQHWRITAASQLPTLTSPSTIIDGLTQAGAAAGNLWAGTPHTLKVELFGNGLNSDALIVSGANSGVRGLVVGGFGGNGVTLAGDGGFLRTSYVGLDVTGTTASNVGNANVLVSAGADPEVGGLGSGDGNVLAGTSSIGIFSFGGVTGLAIRGNFIGSNATGTASVGTRTRGYNNFNGTVTFREVRSNLWVGSTRAFAAEGDDTWAPRAGQATWAFAGNHVGVGRDGSTVLANGAGVGIYDASQTTLVTGMVIGGTTAADRNVISGNTGYGLYFRSPNAGLVIQGNYIGVAANGTTARGNGGDGITLETNNAVTVGGTAAGAGNVIANNGGRGVNVVSGTGAVTIRGNAMYANTNAGIDLGNNGLTLNDGAKSAGQPNQLMDHPVFTTTSLSGNTLTLAGYVGSAAGQSVFANATVDVYVSDNDLSGFGEGQVYLGTLTADANGNFSGSIDVTGRGVVSGSTRLTGTATDGSGNTSEFGANRLLANATLSGRVFEDVNYGGGPGRTRAASGGSGRSGATVEIYSSAGAFLASTTTDINGDYAFGVSAPNTYQVRVVNSTVSSSRAGWVNTLLPVQTFRTQAVGGVLSSVADAVGGENPALVDAAANTTNALLSTLTTASTTAQSVASIAVAASDITGVDFGFNFGTVVNTNDSGQGSLRQAITNANALGGDASLAVAGRTAGVEHVVFMIPNGTTGAGGSLNLAAGGLRSSLNYFTTAAGSYNVATVTAQSRYFITAGLVVDAQTQPGWTLEPRLEIRGDTAGNTEGLLNLTGGSSTVRGLVLNRFGGEGIKASDNSNGHVIQGCWIGVTAAGNAGAAIGLSAVWLSGSGNSHVIGGTSAAQRNVLSGTTYFEGLAIWGGSGHLIQGNYIGTNSTGSAAVSNFSWGIKLYPGVTNSTVGGTAAGAGNVVSSSQKQGVYLMGSNVTVQGNFIGTNASGSAAIANAQGGLLVEGSNHVIGGTTTAARNVISGNSGPGIALTGSGHTITGNFIGVAADGSTALANTAGVTVGGTGGHTIGGSTAGERNVISGNSGWGVQITSSNNTLKGNHIGLNQAGTAAVGNKDGVQVAAATNTVGGATAAEGNVITGTTTPWASYTGVGLQLTTASTGSTVRNNLVGLNAAGTAALNPPRYGVQLFGSSIAFRDNTIGGTGLAMWIAGNSNTLWGNRIGVGLDGSTAIGNTTEGGIGFTGSASSNVIGGSNAGEPNIIANSAPQYGIALRAQDNANRPSRNRFTRNVMYGNGVGNGIDLTKGFDVPGPTTSWGVTANDGAVNALEPNNGMDSPVFTGALLSGSTLTVSGYVGSAAGQATFAGATVEVFLSSSNSSGYGEGQAYIGTLTADASGNISGSITVPGTVTLTPTVSRITGTATDANGNTSEFGLNVLVIDRYTVTTTQDGAATLAGSLRWALTNANADAGVQTVRFNIPTSDPNYASGVWTITPTSALPAVTDATVIDASTQPGYVGVPLVQIRGTSAGASSNGLQFTTAAGSTVRGLVINGFGGCAVRLDAPGGHTVAGNYIGTAISGSAAATGNGAIGVCVNSSNNTVGGTGANDKNVIGGFVQVSAVQGRGIDIAAGANTNTVAGNWVGLGADGVTAVANQNGVLLTDASSNTIGGSTTAARNVISGNQAIGISLQTSAGSASGNTVAGNYIGTNAAGTAAVANGTHGVSLTGSVASTTIGGSVANAGNLISGNTGRGVLQNGAGITGTVISGNVIGLNAAGAAALANGQGGVDISAGGATTIGGTSSLQRNVISGNTGFGVALTGTGHTVLGNTIGTNPAGDTAIGNTLYGVQVVGTSHVVGGSAAGAGNLISGNGENGVLLSGASTSGNSVQGNTIGLNAAGTAALANGSSDSGATSHGGIRFSNGTTNNLIGGSAAGQGNVIAGNRLAGVVMRGDSTSANNTVQGNRIGVNAAGTVIANGGYGVIIDYGSGPNTIGGVAAGAGNIVRGHAQIGVYVGATSAGNAIRGNSIFGNTRGIGLGLSATANDGVKTTGQPNLLMDTPILTRAVLGSNTLAVVGYVGSAALQSAFGGALVDLYVSSSGQGQTYIGTVTANADGEFAGVVSTAGISGLVAGTTQITATATDGSGNTSEFGNAATTVALGALNVVSNASFETPSRASNALFGTGSTTLTGWVVTGNSVDAGGSLNAAQGTQSVDLSGNTRGGLAQVVQTTPGTTYTLTWALGANPCSPSVKGLRVTAGPSTSTYGFDPAGQTPSTVAWVDRNQVFTATAEATVLWFESLEASGCGAAIDNVRLSTGAAPTATISGTVFEDLNYGGGAGRSRTNATGNSPRPNARVELFDASGNFVTSTTTDASGNYSFTSRALGSYTVRVVCSSVTSSRTGYTSAAVATPTFRADASGSLAIADTAFVGGANPLLSDAGNASSTLAALTTATATAQAISPAALAGDITGLDFGFSFNVVTNTQDSGSGSLRQAITNANTLGGDGTLAQQYRAANAEHIVFMLPNGTAGGGGSLSLPTGGLRPAFNAFTQNGGNGVQVAALALTQGLAVSAPVVLDAQTQPGFDTSTSRPIIALNGSATATGSIGLDVSGGGSTVRGFIVQSFKSHGVRLAGNSNTLQGNWLGLAITGSSAAGNGGAGLYTAIGSSLNQIGGTTAAQRNVISGNAQNGYLADHSSNGTVVQGNYVGLDATGTTAVANGGVGGIALYSDSYTIGGTAAGAGNIISGNANVGVYAAFLGHVILGNRIGTDATGTTAVPNVSHGIVLDGPNVVVGGVAGNLISGNGGSGLVVNATATGVVVLGNRIGTNAAGTAALGNAQSGVQVQAAGITIGGTATGAGNVISGNTGNGIQMLAGASAITVQGNFIGTNAAGTAALANAQNGVLVQAASITIGGTATGAGNVISGNGLSGVRTEANSVTVQGNTIGTNAAGTAAVANGTAGATEGGVRVAAGSGSVIGGAATGAGNLLSGNGGAGVWVDGTANSVTVQGNTIGTNAAGTAAVSNGRWGISLNAGTGHQIGGTAAGAGNLISGNTASQSGAIFVQGTGQIIEGNRIGLNAAGSGFIPNGTGSAIEIRSGSSHRIGGTAAGAGNIIAGNTGVGVAVNGTGTGNQILGNSIYGNSGIGIDVGGGVGGTSIGVTANDGLKTTGAPNLYMDSPVFTAAALAGDQLVVAGYVGNAANLSTFASSRVEVFISDNDSSGFGEGQTYLGFLTADASGNFSGRLTIPNTITITPGTTRLTGTATDTGNNTSEFGANILVTAGVSGRVFEDLNYGGGAGRNWTAASANGAQPRPGARVEIASVSSGVATVFANATTAADGSYALPTPGAGTYVVRVVGDTVLSSRSGATAALRAVPTFVAHAPAGTRVERTDFVGGLNPAATDAGAAAAGATFNTSDGVFTSGATGTANASGTVQLGAAAGITDIDFGFNFSTVVNTNDSGAGSLRQVLTNANTLGGDAALAVAGRTAGVEHVVFMLPNGTTGSGGSLGVTGGLRSSLNVFSGGVATIAPSSALPAIASALVVDAQAQPGWTAAPIVELNGTGAGAAVNGFDVQAAGVTLRGFVINRFAAAGVVANAASSGFTLQGSYIGTNAAGTAASANAGNGVTLTGTPAALIGGLTAAARNVISGNAGSGVQATGTTVTGTLIQGNYIGTNAAGSAAIPNTSTVNGQNGGVSFVAQATGVTVGGAVAGAGNVISGNSGPGIAVSAAGGTHTVQGNLIGLNAAGAAAVPNGQGGISINSAAGGQQIGGTSTLARNVISGNSGGGILFGGSSSATVIQGNYIGTDINGTAAVPNGSGPGISIAFGDAATIGGTAAGAGNLISGNTTSTSGGVSIGTTAGNGSTIQGNTIGLSATGLPLPNGAAGSATGGIQISGGTGHVIGGTGSAARNVIAGNGGAGIRMTGGGATIQGNYIGVKADGTTAAGNGNHGVYAAGISATTLGGSAAGAGNVIANNTGKGITYASGTGALTISANAVYANTGIGIDLADDLVTANDGAKTLGQPNQLIDHPVFTSARARGNQLTVAGYVGSAAGQGTFANLRVEIFESDGDASGFGEGRSYLGFITTDASGNFSGTVTLAVGALRIGTRLTATATDAAGNTSEFGATFANLVVDMVVNDNGDAADATPGDGLCATAGGVCTLRAAIAEFNASAAQSGTPTVSFALPGCSAAGQAACSIAPASALPTVTRPMLIDAQTQPGWTLNPLVELNGAGAGAGTHGLHLNAAGSGVRGFIINRFNGVGIQVNTGATGSTVAGNWIGLNTAGTTASANGGGVLVLANNVTIGGNTAATRNVLSGGASYNLRVGSATGTLITGNYIGTNAAGSAAVVNGSDNLALSAAVNTQIGGTSAALGNVIAGSNATASGIAVFTGSTGTVIQGNTIGMDATGSTAIPNGHGVWFQTGSGATGSSVGGTAAGAGNLIAGNAMAGVAVIGTTRGVSVLGNSIHSNGGLGIDLAASNVNGDGVTANTGSTNAGLPNNGMNFPILSGAGVSVGGGGLTVIGAVGTGSGQAVFAGARIEIFKAAADPSGYGEGRTYLGALTADANGRFSGTLGFAAGTVTVGDLITATATDASGNTSEFGPSWTSTTLAALLPSRFNIFETSTVSGALSGVIKVMTVGQSRTLDAIAIDGTGLAVSTVFTGAITLDWMDARDNSGALGADNCRSSWTAVGSAGSLSFTSGLARSSITLTPPQAGREWRLRITHTPTVGAPVVSCSGDNFAVKPASLSITAVGDDSDTAAAAAASPQRSLIGPTAATLGAGPVHRAGRPFSLRAAAVDGLNVVQTRYDGTPSITLAGCVLPASGCQIGTLSVGSVSASSGVVRSDTLSYSEVGSVQITISDSSFADVDAADSSAAERLVSGSTITVGRFVPDAYTVTPTSTGVLATANAACTASGAGYTFAGQAFGWQVLPQWQVTARNAAGATTRNWTGTLMRLVAATHLSSSFSIANAAGSSLSAAQGPLSLADSGNGVATVTRSNADSFAVSRATNTPLPSFSPTIGMTLALNDTSETGSTGNSATSASQAQSAIAFHAGGVFHHGRLQLLSAHGDARVGVRLLAELQRYSASGWTRISEDRGCITVNPAALTIENLRGRFAGAGMCAAPPVATPITTAGGRAWVAFPASPSALTGAVSARLNLGSAASGNTCNSSGVPVPAVTQNLRHLQGAWGGAATLDQDPRANLTWGRARREMLLRSERFD